jgi:hypothetical protein
MSDENLWEIERHFWLEGADVFAARLDPACLMAFPEPAGVMSGPVIVESLKSAPRWDGLEMADAHLARPADDLAVLAYRALAQRHGAETYQALCTSTYRLDGGTWRLIQHQQTPR